MGGKVSKRYRAQIQGGRGALTTVESDRLETVRVHATRQLAGSCGVAIVTELNLYQHTDTEHITARWILTPDGKMRRDAFSARGFRR